MLFSHDIDHVNIQKKIFVFYFLKKFTIYTQWHNKYINVNLDSVQLLRRISRK